MILKFLRSSDGPTAVEYAVMLALILSICIGAIAMVGLQTQDSVNNSKDRIEESFQDAGVGNL